jgi:glyoxylase-like metal-dependent hydrolase (beta-lactamase superfamily II)
VGIELVPGVRVLAAFDHTPGHLAVEASSSGEAVIYISDAVFHPLHIENPDWLPDAMFIYDTEQFQKTARRLLAQAVAKNALLLRMHFPPFPSLGRINETREEGEHTSLDRASGRVEIIDDPIDVA